MQFSFLFQKILTEFERLLFFFACFPALEMRSDEALRITKTMMRCLLACKIHKTQLSADETFISVIGYFSLLYCSYYS